LKFLRRLRQTFDARGLRQNRLEALARSTEPGVEIGDFAGFVVNREIQRARLAAESLERAGRVKGHPKRFRFLNTEQFRTTRAVQPFNRFPLATARNRLQNAV
jgi:hypothetical protein